MKKLLIPICLMLSLGAVAQAKKDTTKVVVPLPTPPSESIYYIAMPASNWDKIIDMMGQSNYPSKDVQEAIKFLLQYRVEIKPPVADTSKVKKK